VNAALADVFEASEAVRVDPGTNPGASGELGDDVDPSGLLGGSRRVGRGGPSTDGIAGEGGGAGSGAVGGSGAEGGRVSTGSRVPGSLRAYVRRYLRALEESRARSGSSGTGAPE
jgi:hypothetical protein